MVCVDGNHSAQGISFADFHRALTSWDGTEVSVLSKIVC